MFWDVDIFNYLRKLLDMKTVSNYRWIGLTIVVYALFLTKYLEIRDKKII